MRTVQEILARIEAVKDDDWLGVIRSDLVCALPFAEAKPFLKPETTEEGWKQSTDPLGEIRTYLPFAWKKANGCRGLSAGRSLDHMAAWLWLAGADSLIGHLQEYDHYGKAQLVMCSEFVGFGWRAHDDGEWVTTEHGPVLAASIAAAYCEEFAGYARQARQAKQ